MRRKSIVLSSIILAAVAVSSAFGAASQPDIKQQRDRVVWVVKCLTDFRAIKPGMTRAEVERRLPSDGGIQGYVTVRFVHPECPYFKIDVEFAVRRNPEPENRIAPSPDDKVVKVSKPYIEDPYSD